MYMVSSTANNRKRKRLRRPVQLKMLRKFLLRGLTAHGISHMITAKSPFRRMVWICALIATFATMLLMTYNVLQEYLKYPLVRYTKGMSFSQLDFPAVTVCGYSLIPSHNVKEANLRFLEELEQVLGSLPEYGVDRTSKQQCIKDPICRWSRFSDECYCSQKVCNSPECYPIENDTYCACSKVLCSSTVPNVTSACSVVVHEGKVQCVCRKDFVYPKYDNKSSIRLTPDFLQALKHLDPSPEVKQLLLKIKNSTDTSLRDAEQYLRPNITTLDNYGLAFESLILSCNFATQPCNVKYDVTTLYSPTYGKCYMFNYAGENEAGLKVVNNYGQSHGLELYLQAPKANTVPLLAPQYGARVVIHDPRSLPFASQKGFDIRAGDLTSVVLKMEITNRLGPPWSDCAWDGDNRTSNYLEIPYSKLGCDRKCFNDEMYKECKCYSARLLSGSVIPKRRYLCGSEDGNCIGKVLKQYFQKNITCKCPQPCRHKSYDTDIFASKMNQEFFRFTKLARSLKLINGTPAVADPSFNLGMMGLQVYFNSFNVLTFTETSIYSWEFLVANIGGNMGLFLGLSLITFVEVAEFIFDIFVQTFCRRRRSQRSVDSNLQTKEYTIENINVVKTY